MKRKFLATPCKFDNEGYLISPSRQTALSKRVIVPTFTPPGDLDDYFSEVQTRIFNTVFAATRAVFPQLDELGAGVIVDYCHLILAYRTTQDGIEVPAPQELFPAHLHLVLPDGIDHLEVGVNKRYEITKSYSSYPAGRQGILERIVEQR